MGFFNRTEEEKLAREAEKAQKKAERQAEAERRNAELQEQMKADQEKREKLEQLVKDSHRLGSFTSKETKETYELYDKAVVYSKGMFTREVHPLAGATARLESGSELESRVTATRLLLTGVFAFAFKKKKGGEKYVTIDGSDFAMMIEVPRKQIKDAMKFVNSVNNAAMKLAVEMQGQSSDAEQNSDDIADQLAKIASLHDSGVLSDDEFNAAKDRILGI